MNILIIGGSRFVGRHLVSQLVQKHQVTVFNRGQTPASYPESVKFIKGDRNHDFEINEHYDTVIDMMAYNGAQTEAALDQLKFDHFIHFGTVASYEHSEIFPLTEDSPQDGLPFMGEYGRGKAECERVLEASGRKYASIRPTYVLGAHNYIDREAFIYRHLRDNSTIILPGNGQALVQFVTAEDVASVLTLLVEKQLTGAYNVGGDELITLLGLVELMADISGHKPKIDYNPAADGARHDISEFPFANENLYMSNAKLKQLGMRFTPLREGLERDYADHYANATAA